MEFNFIINKCIPLDTQGIGIYEAKLGRGKTMSTQEQQLAQIINTMGEKSALAQGLKQVITSYDKMQATNQRLFIAAEGRQCQGILKVGQKNLFYRDLTGSVKEIKPLCVLDFYVHENYQRQGYGKLLFEYMLIHENVTPEKLAYDRPSPKLIGFLKKHYNLSKYIAQNNNFVVFDQYFKSAPTNTTNQNQINSLINNNHQSNSRQYSQYNISDNSNLPPYPSQSQQSSSTNILGRGHNNSNYKQDNPADPIMHSAQRNNKELANAGRAVLFKDDIYKTNNQQNTENSIHNINNSQYSQKSQGQSYTQQSNQDPYYNNNKLENNQWGDRNIKKPPINQYNDRKLDQIQQKIQQTEKELAQVNQQIIRQRHNLSQEPLSQNHQAQNQYNTNSFGSSPWANTGFSTSSSNYGNHYTYYKK